MLVASPGERLRTLRDLLGLSQAALAEASGVSQALISNVERGATDPSSEMLEAIAAATGTPVGFFFVAPANVPLDSLRFRKLVGASRKVTDRVHAFFGESYRVTENLVAAERYPAPDLPYATGDEISAEQIESLAEDTRAALRLAPDKPIPHLTRAMERAGLAVAPISLPGIDGEEHPAPEHFGVSFWGGIGAPALVGYFPAMQGDRDRFTLAHEVAHAVLHTFRPRVPRAPAETEAHRFAAALLVPRRRAVDDLSERTSLTDYARHKATWGVSIQCLIMRAHAVGVIDDTRRRSLFVQLSTRGWRKHEPVTVGREEPRLLWTLLSKQFGAKPYRPAAEKLAVPPAVLRSIAPTPTQPEPRVRQPSSAGSNVVQIRRRSEGVRKTSQRRAAPR